MRWTGRRWWIAKKGTKTVLQRVWKEAKVGWCKVFHRGEYVCFDDLSDKTALSGPRCHSCNRCWRVWTTPNPRKFPSEYGRVWAGSEYVSGIKYTCRDSYEVTTKHTLEGEKK